MTQATRIQALATEIRRYCQAHADPDQARRYARYFKEGYDGWGLLGQKEHPLWNEKQKEWLTQNHVLKLCGFFKLGELLFAGGKFEEGSLAIRFLKEFRTGIGPHELKHLARWFQAGVKNWAHADALCGEVIAPLLESTDPARRPRFLAPGAARVSTPRRPGCHARPTQAGQRYRASARVSGAHDDGQCASRAARARLVPARGLEKARRGG